MKKKALQRIKSLFQFYNIIVFSNHINESEATQIDFRETIVNEFVKQLFEIWKLNWQKIQKIERKFMMSSIQRKMMKRANDQNDERQKKIRDLV